MIQLVMNTYYSKHASSTHFWDSVSAPKKIEFVITMWLSLNCPQGYGKVGECGMIK